MRRIISRLKPLWLVLVFFGATLGVLPLFGAVPGFVEAVPSLVVIAMIALGVVLSAVHPKASEHEPHMMAAPVRGRWAARNTPGQQLPSHGSRFLGQYAAIDILQPTTAETPPKVQKGWRNSPPQKYPCFGAPVYAMADGVVTGAWSGARDHRARNTWQGLIYMMTLEGMVRSVAGRGAILGSSEPHLHVHLMDRANPYAAAGLKMAWEDIDRPGEIEPSLKEIARGPAPNAVRSMPRNGEIFEV